MKPWALNRAVRRVLPALAAFLALAGGAGLGAAWAEPVQITALQLRKDNGALNIHFFLSAPTDFELVGNVAQKVLVVKFHNAVAGFGDGRRVFLFNDPMVEGVHFDEVGDGATWAKIKLRSGALAFKLSSPSPASTTIVSLKVQPSLIPPELENLRLGKVDKGSRLVLDLNRGVTHELEESGSALTIRLKGTGIRRGLKIRPSDSRVAVKDVRLEKGDTLVELAQKPGLVKTVTALSGPNRLVVDFLEAPEGSAAPDEFETQKKKRLPVFKPAPAEDLSELEPNFDIRQAYLEAERDYRSGRMRKAAQDFIAIYRTWPKKPIGVRAYFRSADAQYQLAVAKNLRNFHGVISTYQSALRAADAVGYRSSLVPAAFFRIAQSYQEMSFYSEANVHFEILQERFPDNLPYTADSYLYRGEALMGLRHWDEAAEQLGLFIESEGNPKLMARAYYKLGEVHYTNGRYKEARDNFDQGRKRDAEMGEADPRRLFQVAESYFENAEFEMARELYQKLINRYPDKTYAKLVALRLGDFLRDEGKEADALRLFKQVMAEAPPEVKNRAAMRVANLYAARPLGNSYKEALAMYDQIIEADRRGPLAEEAMLRRALTLTLHRQYLPAIAAFEEMKSRFPKSPYVRRNIIQDNIDENLKGLADDLHQEKKDYELVKLYGKYQDTYFADFPMRLTLFQVADAYNRLGLYDDAGRVYALLEKHRQDNLSALGRYRAAMAQLDRGNISGAEEKLLEFIQKYPESPYLTDVQMSLGALYVKARRHDDALKAYKHVVADFKKAPNSILTEVVAEAYFDLGQIYRDMGRHKEAADSMANVLPHFNHPIQGREVPPFVILAQFYLGDALFELGLDNEAMEAYTTAAKRYPTHERAPWAYYQMGLIHRRNNRDQEALTLFNNLVEQAKKKPGEMWETLARENQRELTNKLQYQDYLKQ